MSEIHQNQSRPLSLLTLVLLLVIVVGMQAWYILEMEQRLEAENVQQADTQLSVQEAIAQVAEIAVTEDDTNDQPSPVQEVQITEQSQPRNEDVFDSPFHARLSDFYRDVQRMQRHLDSTFNNRYNRINKRPDYEYHFSSRVSSPEIDVREDAYKYLVFINIPGTDQDNISVNLQRQRLSIKAKQGYEKKGSDPSGRFKFRERQSGSFSRSILLTEPVDANGMKTRVENGVLTVMIPKIRR